jgi:putative transposase
MTCDAARHRRRSIRLQGYDDRRAGANFVTIVAQDRVCQFGAVVEGVMVPSEAGRMVRAVWAALPAFYPGVVLDAFALMPNHLPGIVILTGGTGDGNGLVAVDRGADGRGALWPGMGQARGPAPMVAGGGPDGLSLADAVHRFKTLTTKLYADRVHSDGWPAFRGRLWQRDYCEHSIRGDAALDAIRRSVDENPWRWDLDPESPLRWERDPENPGRRPP